MKNNKRMTKEEITSIVRISNECRCSMSLAVDSCKKKCNEGCLQAVEIAVAFIIHQVLQFCAWEALLEVLSQFRAHSAASSLALLRFFPSYQYRAARVWPRIVTWLDQAVRPPIT